MANQKNDNFLGGTPRFNKVGYGQQGSTTDSALEETSLPPITAVAPSNSGTRTVIIVVVLLVLIGVAYFVGEVGLGGVQHTGGEGGRPGALPSKPAPPSNF